MAARPPSSPSTRTEATCSQACVTCSQACLWRARRRRKWVGGAEAAWENGQIIYMLSEGFVLVFGLAGVQATCGREGRGVCRLRSPERHDTHVRPGEIERILLFFISDSQFPLLLFSPHLSA